MQRSLNVNLSSMSAQLIFCKRNLLSAILLLLGLLAYAYFHVTHLIMTDVFSGFSHPLEGWDHIVTMLGVGIWAAQLRGKAIWLLPVIFVSVMSLGGVSGAASYLVIPSAEVLIITSCLVFSALIIRKIHFSTKINVLIVAFFAFFHGYAHGQEISTSASLVSYTAGFMLATMLLHGTGILVAKVVLLSATFLISLVLNINITQSDVVEIETSVVHSFVSMTNEDCYQCDTQKPPLINQSITWSALSSSREVISLFFVSLKMYFCGCLLLCVFYISQFFCYIFYPKQHCAFVWYPQFLACCFKKSFHLLTLHAFQSLQFSLALSAFFKANNRAPHCFVFTCKWNN